MYISIKKLNLNLAFVAKKVPCVWINGSIFFRKHVAFVGLVLEIMDSLKQL